MRNIVCIFKSMYLRVVLFVNLKIVICVCRIVFLVGGVLENFLGLSFIG